MWFKMVSVMRSCLLTVLVVAMFCRVTSDCDISSPMVSEGNIGQSAAFPWLGVLRVQLTNEYGDKPNIALTGIVLIKKRYALVSADDVVRLPKRIFEEHTHAMFMAHTDDPWYCRPKSFKVHEEYEYRTVNTIAVLELDLEEGMQPPVLPICWTHRMSFHTSLYLTGYTDENSILEKVIHKMQHLETVHCDIYYRQSELTDSKRAPVHYVCCFSKSKNKCIWENGMVLVSNASQHFQLVGFSIQGPGCAAPARFIDLRQYYKWVEGAIAPKKIVEDDYRKDNKGVHELGVNEDLSDEDWVPAPPPMGHVKYGFDTDKPRYFNVDEVDNQTLRVFPFNETVESYDNACEQNKVLIYKEHLELKSIMGLDGVAYYKISLYDLMKKVCGCVHLHIDSKWRSLAYISYKEIFDIGEGTALTSSEETPESHLKYFNLFDRTTSSPTERKEWRPSHVLKPHILVDERIRQRIMNYDLYVRFGFYGHATMKVEMYSQNIPPTSSTTPIARRMFENVPLTSQEERLVYLKQKRVKMTRPPSRKMWYDKIPKNRTIRSGLVKSVPKTISNYFDRNMYTEDIYDIHVSKIENQENEDIEPELDAESENTYLKFIQSTAKPAKERFTFRRDSVEEDDMPERNQIPEFIINAIRALSSAPRVVNRSTSILYSHEHVENMSVVAASSASVISHLDDIICLTVFVFLLNL